jgi:Collagen triple helix repeat (20 copies)
MSSIREFRRALLAVAACALLGSAGAQTAPNLLHFQARLNLNTGAPLNGTHNLRVAIYGTPTGGAALWQETQSVTALNGVVNTLLGGTTILPTNLFDGADLYMGLKVDTDPEMTPRNRIASTPYARAAADVPNADINPNSVTINGTPVIDSSGQWIGSPTGLVGPQGPIGPAGPQGTQGTQGTQGNPGPAGATGAQGPQGDPGTPGATGSIGPQGPAGATGAQGDPGAAGAQGPQGDPGVAGAQGPQGDPGVAGAQGDPGPAGPQGSQGPQGDPGSPGATGATGPQGVQGDPGVQGPQGVQGVPGATGPQGPIGTNGPKLEDNGLTGWGVDVAAAPQKLIATVQPTVGTTIGSAKVYGENSGNSYEVLKVNLTTGVATSLGSAAVNSAVNFADFAPTINDYLAMRLDSSTPAHTIFGAHLNGADLPGTDFSDPFASAANWTFTAPNPLGVAWSVDASPALILGQPTFQSAPFSLNWNNGTDFNGGSGVIVTGAATSNVGLINLTGQTGITLTFACNYATETTTTAFDKRFVEFSNNGFTSANLGSLQLAQLGQSVGINACAAQGVWHTHTVATTLTAAGGANVQMRFRFDSVDGTINTGAGWFVEDVAITASSLPSTPGPAVQRVTADQFQANDD